MVLSTGGGPLGSAVVCCLIRYDDTHGRALPGASNAQRRKAILSDTAAINTPGKRMDNLRLTLYVSRVDGCHSDNGVLVLDSSVRRSTTSRTS